MLAKAMGQHLPMPPLKFSVWDEESSRDESADVGRGKDRDKDKDKMQPSPTHLFHPPHSIAYAPMTSPPIPWPSLAQVRAPSPTHRPRAHDLGPPLPTHLFHLPAPLPMRPRPPRPYLSPPLPGCPHACADSPNWVYPIWV
ncbi:hypothetical protein AX14_003850 [Amanita brunnescens Koide BX004]|nr:hypothetical protein AX14_003850 [Amanita brunnescens Koide BX004]